MARSELPTTDEDPAATLASDFSDTARILFSAGSVKDTLAEIVAHPGEVASRPNQDAPLPVGQQRILSEHIRREGGR